MAVGIDIYHAPERVNPVDQPFHKGAYAAGQDIDYGTLYPVGLDISDCRFNGSNIIIYRLCGAYIRHFDREAAGVVVFVVCEAFIGGDASASIASGLAGHMIFDFRIIFVHQGKAVGEGLIAAVVARYPLAADNKNMLSQFILSLHSYRVRSFTLTPREDSLAATVLIL